MFSIIYEQTFFIQWNIIPFSDYCYWLKIIHYDIKKNRYIGPSANRDNDGDFGFVLVSGRLVNDDRKESAQNNLDVLSDGSLSIIIAGPNLSQKQRASIIYHKLKINDIFRWAKPYLSI